MSTEAHQPKTPESKGFLNAAKLRLAGASFVLYASRLAVGVSACVAGASTTLAGLSALAPGIAAWLGTVCAANLPVGAPACATGASIITGTGSVAFGIGAGVATFAFSAPMLLRQEGRRSARRREAQTLTLQRLEQREVVRQEPQRNLTKDQERAIQEQYWDDLVDVQNAERARLGLRMVPKGWQVFPLERTKDDERAIQQQHWDALDAARDAERARLGAPPVNKAFDDEHLFAFGVHDDEIGLVGGKAETQRTSKRPKLRPTRRTALLDSLTDEQREAHAAWIERWNRQRKNAPVREMSCEQRLTREEERAIQRKVMAKTLAPLQAQGGVADQRGDHADIWQGR